MKKFLALFLALVMVLSMSLTAVQAEGAKVTIEFWHTHGETFGGPALGEIVKTFNETNGKGIEVREVVYTGYSEINTNLQSAVAANTAPAVSTCSYSNLNYMAQNFPYVSPTTIIEKYFPEDADYLATKYDPAILNLGVAVTGDLLGCPYGLSVPLMYYNADILDEAGLDKENLPKTWQEIRVYAETILEKTGLPGLYIQLPTDTYSIIPMFLCTGIDEMYTKDENGNFVSQFVTDETVEVWTFMQEMYKEGAAVFMTNTEALAAFTAGLFGMYLTTSARINQFSEADPNYVASMAPAWKDNQLAVCLGGNILTIWTNKEEEQKAAWELIKFLLQPENVAAFDNGTGYVPPTQDVTDEQYTMMNHPLLKDNIGEKAYAKPWTSWPGKNGAAIDKVLISLRDQIINDFVEVRPALEKAAAEIDELLK